MIRTEFVVEAHGQRNAGGHPDAFVLLAVPQNPRIVVTVNGHDVEFRHKGLRTLFEAGNAAGVQPNHAKRLRMQLAALDSAHVIDDMDIPGFPLHPLKGGMAGRWSITVNGNWRMTFEFREGNAFVLNYEDYH